MRPFIILILCGFLSASCSKVETVSTENIQITPTPTVATSPTIETVAPLKPVITKVKLNSEQKKYLDESLPPQVREVLEKAEKFEVLAEVRGENENDGESMTFEPNHIAKIVKENDKKEILEAFYFDASRETGLSACYYPRHKLRAIYQGKTVEVEICFICAIFVVKGEFGHFEGTITRENRKSENVLNRIIKNQSVELKQ
jgi:hypothetical protein